MSEWRSRLTAGEAEELAEIERDQRNFRLHLQSLAIDKKAIVNRAIQRKYSPNQKNGVYTEAESA